MANAQDQIGPEGPAQFSDDAWVEVLSAVDLTYADLVSDQEQLERQNAELQEMRTFLTVILSSVSDVLILADRAGRVAQVSASVMALVGQPVPDGPPPDLFADPAHLVGVLQTVRDSCKGTALEANLVTATGVEPLDISVAPRLDDRGRVDGFVLTGRPLGALRTAYADLSESHQALKLAQAFLLRNEKLALLGRLLAGVAHELNNPISFVYANAHALDRYAGKFETYFARVQEGAGRDELIALRQDLRLDRALANLREAIGGARAGAERVRDIVEDLRRRSSDGSGESVAFDLAQTARTAAEWVLRGMNLPVTLDTSGIRETPVMGPAGHVQQVVMNLIQNALDALEGQTGGIIRLTVAPQGGRAVLTVSDNGPGVPEAVQASIFDPFFTTRAVGRGTGLGLSISHKNAEEHGGTLALCDTAEGAAFRLDLPLAEGAA